MNAIKIRQSLEDKSKEELIEDYIALYKKKEKIEEEKEKLEKELHKYKNAHTPSSQKRFEKIQALGLKVGRKKGKKSHHKGKTREKDKPIHSIEVTAKANPSTGNRNIMPTGGIEEVIITDFEIVKVVTQYNCYEYIDLDTGEIFVAKHPSMPNRGIFGKNVEAFVNFLRWKCRVPFDKIAFASTHILKIPMTAPTSWDICNRAAEKVSPHYDKLKEDILTDNNN